MSETTTETTGAAATAATETTAEATAATTSTEAATTAPVVAEPKTVEELPAWAQKQIKDLRKDDGDERVAAKTLAAIQKALNPGAKGGEQPNAEQLTAQLTEQATAAKQAQTELAVYKLAGKHGADADALLDSRTFLAKIADLDHTDTKAVTKAITDAITENPKLKAAQAVATSRVDTSGGSGEGAITKVAFDAMSNADRNKLYNTNLPLYRQLSGK